MMCQHGFGVVVFGLSQPNTAKPYKSIIAAFLYGMILLVFGYEIWPDIITIVFRWHGVNLFCVVKSTVLETNKSQTNKQNNMFTDLYIIALLSNW